LADCLLQLPEEVINVSLVPAQVNEHFLVGALALGFDDPSRKESDLEVMMPRPVRRGHPGRNFGITLTPPASAQALEGRDRGVAQFVLP